jgi:hypothetical protein
VFGTFLGHAYADGATFPAPVVDTGAQASQTHGRDADTLVARNANTIVTHLNVSYR